MRKNRLFSAVVSIIISLLLFSCKEYDDVYDPLETDHYWSYYSTDNGLPSDTITYVYEDNSGAIWVATKDKGVARLSGNTWTTFDTDDGLLKNKVMSIAQDKKGDIWFSTSFGFSVYDGSDFTNIQKTTNDEWIFADEMIIDKRGWVWATDYYNQGFYLYDGFEMYYFLFEGSYANVIALAENNAGTVFLACYGSVFLFRVTSSGQEFVDYSPSSKLYADYTKAMFFDSRGNSWFGHLAADKVTRISSGDADYINLFNGWSYTNVTSILEDDQNNIWFTMMQGGVIKYNGIEPQTFGINSGLSGDGVNCSMKDNSGNLWFGTNGNGISIYHPVTYENN